MLEPVQVGVNDYEVRFNPAIAQIVLDVIAQEEYNHLSVVDNTVVGMYTVEEAAELVMAIKARLGIGAATLI